MAIVLASTFRPVNDLARFSRVRPRLAEMYAGIATALPPSVSDQERKAIEAEPGVNVAVAPEKSHARHLSIQIALDLGAEHIHYVDMDRAMRWVESRPDELRLVIEAVRRTECLILGRTPRAFSTHPRSLQKTEAMVNKVFSCLLGRELDLCAGSRGFGRRAAEFLMANSPPGRWVDAEWPVLLHANGFALDYSEVDGLDYETADRFAGALAGAEEQRHIAEQIDADPKKWEMRVDIALEQIEAGLDALLTGSLRGAS